MRKGFTLIELLIVVIIIGILVTLALPQLTSMIEKARTAEGKLGLGALRTALAVHVLESDNFPEGTYNRISLLEVVLGDIISDKSRFNYGFYSDNTADPKECSIYAERNRTDADGNSNWNSGNAAHAKMRLIVYADGSSSDLKLIYVGAGSPPPAYDSVVDETGDWS